MATESTSHNPKKSNETEAQKFYRRHLEKPVKVARVILDILGALSLIFGFVLYLPSVTVEIRPTYFDDRHYGFPVIVKNNSPFFSIHNVYPEMHFGRLLINTNLMDSSESSVGIIPTIKPNREATQDFNKPFEIVLGEPITQVDGIVDVTVTYETLFGFSRKTEYQFFAAKNDDKSIIWLPR